MWRKKNGINFIYGESLRFCIHQEEMLRGKLLLLPYIFDSWRMAPGDVVAKVSWPKFNNRASESTATPERIDKKCFCLGIPSVIHAAGSTNTLGVATHNGELLFRADGFQRPLVRKKSSRRAASFLGSLSTKRLRRQTKEEKTKGQQPSRPIASALVFPPPKFKCKFRAIRCCFSGRPRRKNS